jgi:hypothetical protein
VSKKGEMAGRSESFFHGTASHISDAVRPGAQVGKTIWGRTGESHGQASEEHAFATSDEDEAWRFARYAGGADKSTRARVYTVAPHPDMKVGVHHPGHAGYSADLGEIHEYVAPEFKVTGRHDIAPGHQGTFPNINWHQFSHPDIAGDPNHPTLDETTGHGQGFYPGTFHAEAAKVDRKLASLKPNRDVVSSGQMDLYTGRTAQSHADEDKGGTMVGAKARLAAFHQRRLNPIAASNETLDNTGYLHRQALRRKGRK